MRWWKKKVRSDENDKEGSKGEETKMRTGKMNVRQTAMKRRRKGYESATEKDEGESNDRGK